MVQKKLCMKGFSAFSPRESLETRSRVDFVGGDAHALWDERMSGPGSGSSLESQLWVETIQGEEFMQGR